MIIMEYLSKENVSLLDTVDDVSVWTPADIKVCVYTCYLQENIVIMRALFETSNYYFSVPPPLLPSFSL